MITLLALLLLTLSVGCFAHSFTLQVKELRAEIEELKKGPPPHTHSWVDITGKPVPERKS